MDYVLVRVWDARGRGWMQEFTSMYEAVAYAFQTNSEGKKIADMIEDYRYDTLRDRCGNPIVYQTDEELLELYEKYGFIDKSKPPKVLFRPSGATSKGEVHDENGEMR